MVKRIVHISICNNYDGLNRLLYINECIDAGLDVGYINLNGIVGGEIQNTSPGKYIPETSVSSLDELDDILKKMAGDTLFNIQIGYEYRWRFIFEIIKKRCDLSSTFSVGKYPTPGVVKSVNLKSLKVLPKKILARMDLTREKYYPDYVFAAGMAAARPYLGKSKIVKIEFEDYCSTSANSRTTVEIPKNYSVFLDQYTPYHPDRALTGIYSNDVGLYYDSLLAYFQELEKLTGVEVVVAAHPKSEYPNNFFGGRRVIKNHTEKLVENSSLVVAQFSTAVSFAIKYKKPLIFVSSTDKTGLDIERLVVPFAKYLNAPMHKLGKPIEGGVDFKYDNAKYDEYKFDFLTWPETSEIVSANAFPEFIKNLTS